MAEGYLVSADTLKLIRELSARVDKLEGKSVRRNTDAVELDPVAPEVYLAKSPIAGIPPMVATEPGSAQCQIYRTVGGTVKAVAGYYKLVHNYSPSIVPGELWLAVGRDKYGTWMVLEVYYENILCDDEDTGTGSP